MTHLSTEAERLAELLSADPTESPVSLAAAVLLRRIPELEAEVQEQARLNRMGAERELALRSQVLRLEAERDRLSAALATHPAQAQQAGEPYAYAVYFPDQPTEMLVHDLDELLDDMTNRQHTITKLYTATPTPPAQAARQREGE